MVQCKIPWDGIQPRYLRCNRFKIKGSSTAPSARPASTYVRYHNRNWIWTYILPMPSRWSYPHIIHLVHWSPKMALEVLSRSRMTNHLLIFTTNPVPEYAKTRLIPSQRLTGAAEIYRLSTEHTLLNVRQAEQNNPSIRVLIHCANLDSVPESFTECWLRPNECEELVSQRKH